MRRLVLALCGLLALVGVYAARVQLLTAAGGFLIEEDRPQAADAIVVLAGSLPDRIMEAATLYNDGFAPRILLSRAPESGAVARARAMGLLFPSASDLNRWAAAQLGVPPQAIIEIGGRDKSTFTEAHTIVSYLLEQGHQRILLVTSKMHTRRAALIFRYLAGGRLHFLVRPSRYDSFDPATWWHDRAFTRRAIIEYEKLLVFFLVDRWRMGPVAG